MVEHLKKNTPRRSFPYLEGTFYKLLHVRILTKDDTS